jgi:hypothetical protein
VTASQLIAEVQRIVQDSTAYPADVVLSFLNLALNDVSAWDNINPELGLVGNVLLPALETNDEVTTDVATTDPVHDANPFVDLPADYQKNLYQVTFVDQTLITKIWPDMRSFLEEWNGDLTHSGPVEDVVIVGSKLYYQPIPETATDLTLWYYAKPTPLAQHDPADAETDDIPSCIPVEFHRDLLVNYALKEIYDEIEDGLEGPKVNTLNYRAKYQQGLQRLYWAVKHKSIQKTTIRRRAMFF